GKPGDRGPARLFHPVRRPVALRRAQKSLAVDPDLDRRLGFHLAVRALLGDHAEALEPEERGIRSRLAAQQQLERGVGSLVLIAAVLALLESLHGALGGVGVQVDARGFGAALHRASAGERGVEYVAAVA